MPGVLEGLTVIDLSTGISGPMAAMLLADQGADVLKIEPPDGDPTREDSGWRVWNRGKRSVVLDTGTAPGLAQLHRLIGGADVLIENLEETPADELGLSFAALHRANPRLIHCSITGYGGFRGHAGRPAIDALVAARTGLQWEKRGWPGGSIEHINKVEPFLADLDIDPEIMEGPPRPGPLFSSVPWPSLSAFYLASMGISAALHARELTGRGQHVATSLFQGAIVNGTFCWQRVDEPERPGYRMWVTDPRAPHGFFKSSDDRWVHHWTPQPGFVLSVSAGDRLEVTSETRAVRDDAARIGMDPEDLLVLLEYIAPMTDAFGRFTAAEWERVAAQASVSVQTVRSPEEAFQTQFLLDDGCVVQVDDPVDGPIRHVGLTYHLHAKPGSVTTGAPTLGQHTAAALAELLGQEAPGPSGPSDAAESSVDLSRGPLTGLLVLDLGLAVAGPFGAQMLADLGADVIKVNRESDRSWTDTYMGMCCNRGKRSITINLKSENGKEIFLDLVKRADVVHSNMHWDSIEKLGIDYESLKLVNSRLIYCHTRGFENGPRLLLPGHDQSGSAVAGMAWEEGGVDNGGKPIWPNVSLGDLGNGLLSATAVIQALYHRDRTGEGQFVDTSIAYVHLLNVSSAWSSADGALVPDRPRLDAMHYGTSALYGLYETAEGWLCLAVRDDEEWAALVASVAEPSLSSDSRFASADGRRRHDADLRDTLAGLFSSRSAAEWFTSLDAAGVPVEISTTTFAWDLFDDPELIERQTVVTHHHPLVGKLEMFGRLIDFSETPTTVDRGPLVPGQHTREILTEFGYDRSTIDQLIATGNVRQMD